VAFVTIALIFTLITTIQNQKTWFWRALVFMVFTYLLLNPSLREQEKQPLPMNVYVFIDNSPSQQLDNRAEQTDEALNWIVSQFKENETIIIKTVTIESDAQSETAIIDTMVNTLKASAENTVAAVFLISDGQIHDMDRQAPLAPYLKNTPLHALITGKADEKDQKITLRTAPLYGIIGQQVTATLQVDQHGYNTKNGLLTLTKDDQIYQIPYVVGEAFTVTLDIDKSGQNVFVFELPEQNGELTTLNNKTAIIVKGIRDRLKVMLISGRPHAGGRMWRNTLKSDPSVDLVHFTILRDLEKSDPTPQDELALIPFPVRELFEVKINEFDLIIFDQYDQIELLPAYYFDNIARFVENGGGFLAAEGPSFASPQSIFNTGLAPLLPASPDFTITDQAFTPTLTDKGKYHPVTRPLTDIKPENLGQFYRQLNTHNIRGDVLLNGANEQALLVLDRYGKGRVAQILSDQIWLWARGWGTENPYLSLMRNTLHWLMKEPDLEDQGLFLSASNDQISVDLRDPTHAQNATPEIQITTPSGANQSQSLSETSPFNYSGLYKTEETGLYKMSIGDYTRYIMLGEPNPTEFQEMRSTKDILAPTVKNFNGKIERVDDALSMQIAQSPQKKHFASARRFLIKQGENFRILSTTQKPFIPLHFVLGLFLVMIGICWWKESGVTLFKKRHKQP
jgi:hypothetical protein